MKNINARVLTGRALDFSVSIIEGLEIRQMHVFLPESKGGGYLGWLGKTWSPSTDWAQGGPIIEREKINLHFIGNVVVSEKSRLSLGSVGLNVEGETPLIAAMRCYVASKLGESVDIPEGLQPWTMEKTRTMWRTK